MLVIKRKEGQWVEIVHEASGDVMRVRLFDILKGRDAPGRAHLGFEDDQRNFTINREREVGSMPPPRRRRRMVRLDGTVENCPVS